MGSSSIARSWSKWLLYAQHGNLQMDGGKSCSIWLQNASFITAFNTLWRGIVNAYRISKSEGVAFLFQSVNHWKSRDIFVLTMPRGFILHGMGGTGHEMSPLCIMLSKAYQNTSNTIICWSWGIFLLGQDTKYVWRCWYKGARFASLGGCSFVNKSMPRVTPS